jgi:hypothetical protein
MERLAGVFSKLQSALQSKPRVERIAACLAAVRKDVQT